MVQTRQQRKRGVNITPVVLDKENNLTKKSTESKQTNDVLEKTPERIRKNVKINSTEKKEVKKSVIVPVLSEVSEGDGDETCRTSSNNEKNNLYDENDAEQEEEQEIECDINYESDVRKDELTRVDIKETVEESSDDEAPESMTFDMAKETALETLHQAYQQSVKLKSKKKEKRREHDKRMKEQAKKKFKRCEELESNRLPEIYLKKVNKDSTENIKKSQDNNPEENKGDAESYDDDDEDEEILSDEGDQDDIVEKDGFHIVPLQKFTKYPVIKSEAASNFRQEQLYGKRIPRVTAPTHMSMVLKRSSKPAINFKVKGLAVTKKERKQKRNNWTNLIR